MAVIQIVGGDGTVTDENIHITPTFTIDGDEIVPEATQRLEWDHEGSMARITTVCGHSENRRNADKGPRLVAEGVCGEQIKNELKTLSQGQQIEIASDVETGTVEIRRVTIEQNNDLKKIIVGNEERTAFAFQIQMRKP